MERGAVQGLRGHFVDILKKISIPLVVGFLAGAVEAAPSSPLSIRVQLQSLVKIRQQERKGDEIFMHITEVPLNGKGTYYQLPIFPYYWPSDFLTSIQKGVAVLWKESLACQNYDLIFSLGERDLPPWDPDDELGRVVLRLRCQNNRFTKQWHIPDLHKATFVPGKEDTFIFIGNGAKYYATFVVKAQPEKENTREPHRE